MKKNILKLTAILLILVGVFSSCQKGDGNNFSKLPSSPQNSTNNSSYPTDSIYYVVGYHMNCGMIVEGETAKATTYFLISENLKDTLTTCNLPDTLFNFPATIIYSANCCGFKLFPQEYRFVYKVQMICRAMTIEEQQNNPVDCACHPNLGLCDPIRFELKPIVITSIFKNSEL